MTTHILLIEDDVEQRGEILEYMLRRRHRVTACASISEAGEALDGAVPDAVVSDVQLPDGDGVTFYGNNARRQMDPDVWQPRSRTVGQRTQGRRRPTALLGHQQACTAPPAKIASSRAPNPLLV
jgi:CheY-like chemotaxis protein